MHTDIDKAVADEIRKQEARLRVLKTLQKMKKEIINGTSKLLPSKKVGCGVKGCKQHSRSKGYCGTHYLKLRKLIELGTAEKLGWKEYPSPGTVKNKKGVTA